MSLERYSKLMQGLLQSRVEFRCNNKILKSGKLTLFNVKQYFFKFTIDTGKKSIKTLELPYPFDVKVDKKTGVCTLNYMLSTIAKDREILRKFLKTDSSNSSKILNNIVYIIPYN